MTNTNVNPFPLIEAVKGDDQHIALHRLATGIHRFAAVLADEHITGVVKSGPKTGQNRWDSEWWHGYHDAFLDLGERVRKLAEEVSPDTRPV